jgi:hypothetical protein
MWGVLCQASAHPPYVADEMASDSGEDEGMSEEDAGKRHQSSPTLAVRLTCCMSGCSLLETVI